MLPTETKSNVTATLETRSSDAVKYFALIVGSIWGMGGEAEKIMLVNVDISATPRWIGCEIRCPDEIANKTFCLTYVHRTPDSCMLDFEEFLDAISEVQRESRDRDSRWPKLVFQSQTGWLRRFICWRTALGAPTAISLPKSHLWGWSFRHVFDEGQILCSRSKKLT